MTRKTWIIVAFVVVALAQLAAVFQMIGQREVVIAKGTKFNFKTAPLDPNDPFRGKYISLDFEANRFAVDSTDQWVYGDKVYVKLTKNKEGFAAISSIHREVPANNQPYIQAEVSYMNFNPSEVFILYPFDRFYMEESKAPVAETVYFESAIDSNSVCWAEVFVLNGKAVISDVKIDGVSIVVLSEGE
jgi:uncharacterized membrane-anchored protein